MNSGKMLYAPLALCLLLGTAAGLTAWTSAAPLPTGQPAKGPVVEYGDGYRFDDNGWIYIHIQGEPHERGVSGELGFVDVLGPGLEDQVECGRFHHPAQPAGAIGTSPWAFGNRRVAPSWP